MVWSPLGVVGDPFEAERRYGVVYADPPWRYRDQATAGRRGVVYKYPLLSDDDIAALPVARIAADDAMLFLWVTWPKLPELFRVIDAWGFSFRTVAFVWVKRTRVSGALAWGMGSWTRANTEPCLLATRGRPKRVSAGVHQVVEAPLARHSEKPAEVRERIVKLAGDVPRIELFARQVVPGWDAWGNDVGSAERRPQAGAPARGVPTTGADEGQSPRQRILGYIRGNGPATRQELVAETGLGPNVIKSILTNLVRNGVLAQRGRTRGTRYELGTTDRTRRDTETKRGSRQRPRPARDP